MTAPVRPRPAPCAALEGSAAPAPLEFGNEYYISKTPAFGALIDKKYKRRSPVSHGFSICSFWVMVKIEHIVEINEN
jgi:hypothetical protein